MIKKISLAKIAPKYAKVKKANPKAVSRTHYLKFLKEENKFFDSADKMAGYINDWSLKAFPEFGNSVVHMINMLREKAKSAYYYHK